MFGLDDYIANASDGTTLLLIVVVAVLLGLRHAIDPDHLAAVTTLIASDGKRSVRAARRLGFVWGLGHATTLFAFGLPIVVFGAYLPDGFQQGAETTVGIVIIALAVWLLVRWHRGAFHLHDHTHLYSHGDDRGHSHGHRRKTRTPLGAYAIGLVHGMGGSAGVGVQLLAAIHSRLVAVAALAIFSFFTAVSMAMVSTGWGVALTQAPMQRSFARLAPALGVCSLAFGVWYSLGALELAPYFF
jgi:high-affinity nickel permease